MGQIRSSIWNAAATMTASLTSSSIAAQTNALMLAWKPWRSRRSGNMQGSNSTWTAAARAAVAAVIVTA